MRDRWSAWPAFALMGFVVLPGSAAAQSLSGAYQAALDHDPDLAAAKASREASDENDALAKSLFRPKVEAQANGGYSRISSNAAVTGVNIPSSVDGVSGSVLLQAEQPLIDGKAGAQRRQLRAGTRAGQVQYEASRQQLALRVSRAYFDVLKADNALTSLIAQEQSARYEQRAAQARFDAGRAKITDVREAQTRADSLAAQIVGARAQREIVGARFAELTGVSADDLWRVRSDLQPVPPDRALGDLQQEAEAQSPAILAGQYRLDAAGAGADQYRWRNQVRVSAIGAAGEFWRGGNQPPLLGVISTPDRVGGFMVGLQLKAPLYTGGGLEAQRRQSQAEARGVGYQVDAARRDVRLQVQEAWLAQSSALQQIAALRTALSSARLQEKAAITGREVGVRTQSDVLAAQAQTLEIERNLNDALIEYEYARLALATAVGTITPATLQLVEADFVGPASSQ